MAPIQIDGESYLTAVEAAIRIGCCDETIRRWVRLGRLPARKLGFQLFILEKDAEAAAVSARQDFMHCAKRA